MKKALFPTVLLLLGACADMTAAREAVRRHDDATAREHLEALSARGFPEALTMLGEMHLSGTGMPADPEKAMDLFRRAAQEDYPLAPLRLGDAQAARGRFKEAEASYKKALEQGLPLASARIGNLYRDGKGRPADLSTALAWYYKARKDGVAEMDARIARTESKMAPDELARALKLSAEGVR